MNNFKLWRLNEKLRQVDVESQTGIRRWKIALLDQGLCALTPLELQQLSKLTGIKMDQLVATVLSKKGKASNEK